MANWTGCAAFSVQAYGGDLPDQPVSIPLDIILTSANFAACNSDGSDIRVSTTQDLTGGGVVPYFLEFFDQANKRGSVVARLQLKKWAIFTGYVLFGNAAATDASDSSGTLRPAAPSAGTVILSADPFHAGNTYCGATACLSSNLSGDLLVFSSWGTGNSNQINMVMSRSINGGGSWTHSDITPALGSGALGATLSATFQLPPSGGTHPGRIAISYADFHGLSAVPEYVPKAIVSDDNGTTWSAPIALPAPYVNYNLPFGRGFCQNDLGGATRTCFLVGYGVTSGYNQGHGNVILWSSSDDCDSFGSSAYSKYEGDNLSETTVSPVTMANGEPNWIFFSRSLAQSEGPFMVSRSTDRGLTWTAPTQWLAGGVSPDMGFLNNGTGNAQLFMTASRLPSVSIAGQLSVDNAANWLPQYTLVNPAFAYAIPDNFGYQSFSQLTQNCGGLSSGSVLFTYYDDSPSGTATSLYWLNFPATGPWNVVGIYDNAASGNTSTLDTTASQGATIEASTTHPLKGTYCYHALSANSGGVATGNGFFFTRAYPVASGASVDKGMVYGQVNSWVWVANIDASSELFIAPSNNNTFSVTNFDWAACLRNGVSSGAFQWYNGVSPFFHDFLPPVTYTPGRWEKVTTGLSTPSGTQGPFFRDNVSVGYASGRWTANSPFYLAWYSNNGAGQSADEIYVGGIWMSSREVITAGPQSSFNGPLFLVFV